MSVNGITNNTSTATYQTTTVKQTESKAAETTSTKKDSVDKAATYDASSTTSTSSTKKNSAIVAQLKADAENRANQLQSLVKQMISKQGNAYGQANDIWKFLASGNFTVDAATKEQAQADIGEDGYWGVNKTSDRILDFAEALCGGDSEKMEEMREAFKKGYSQATGAWGKDLPGISGDTYDAVMTKFDKWQEDHKTVDSVEQSTV